MTLNCTSIAARLQFQFNEITTLNHMYLIQFHKIHVHAQRNRMYKAQYAFNVSMIMCPAVHMATRSLLRSSSTHEPSDPLSRVNIWFYKLYSYSAMSTHVTSSEAWAWKSGLPWRSPLETNNMRSVWRLSVAMASTKGFCVLTKHQWTLVIVIWTKR
jgi:hypothetical protein